MQRASFTSAVAACMGSDAAAGRLRYLLLDGAALQPRELRTARFIGGPWTNVLTLERVDPTAPGVPADHASPWLVSLPGRTASRAWLGQWATFSHTWQYANALTYMECGLDHDEWARVLHQRLDAKLQMDLPVVLRYFDTRIAAALPDVLAPDQRNWLFGSAATWLVCNRAGMAQELASQEPTSSAVAVQPPLQLVPEQEEALMRAAEPDAVIDALLEREHAQLMERSPPQQFSLISDLVAQGRALGVRELPDLIGYCIVALELGADFSKQDPWRAALADVSAGRVRFAECVAKVAQDVE